MPALSSNADSTISLDVISSMATRLLLEDLITQFEAEAGIEVRLESTGGVDAARRIRDGERFDVAILASAAMQKLVDADCIAADSCVDLLRSTVAVAVPAGRHHPDIGTEAALRDAVLSAASIGYSTGPSGVALAALFERWGIDDKIAARIQVPPPGVPVGSLLASGGITLGFQQYSELMHVDGIDVLGPLPDSVRIETIFSGGICTHGRNPDSATHLFEYLRSGDVAECIRRYGMESA
jgi:molybdate transport system substrate-binding protein